MSKKYQPYKEHFDISHMIDEARRDNIAVICAVSRDDQRGCGKTFSTAKWLWEQYEQKGNRFMLMVREVKALGNQAMGVFGGYLKKYHPKTTVFEKKQDNIFSIIYKQTGSGKDKETEIIGYCTVLKNAQDVKNYRGIWEHANIKSFYMDEFMPLDGRYLPNETKLAKTIIDTVNGEVQYMPLILTANCITLGNPWFKMLGLSGNIQSSTHRFKNNKCIYENVEVEGLSDKHTTSALNVAFGDYGDDYVSNVWIADNNNSLVAKPDNWGRPIYICAIVYDNNTYGVYSYPQVGLYYISTNWDKSFNYVYNLTLNGDLNVPLLRNNRTICRLREWFLDGVVRVQHGGIQRMLLDVFS